MQLYAIDEANRLILAQTALKHQDYRCMECLSRVRLRGGMHRKNHFYHLETNSHCRLNGKGMAHLQVQYHLLHLLTPAQCQLEYRFPQIKRIADVVWLPHKLIFEIQCSPIRADEVRQRNEDYKKLGWQVIWILHDTRFNQWRMSAAEAVLRSSPHYFTNIDSNGNGIIYDQFDLIKQGLRLQKLEPILIDPSSFYYMNSSLSRVNDLKRVGERIRHWPFYFQGDLVDLNQQGSLYINRAEEIEKRLEDCKLPIRSTNTFKCLMISLFYQGIIRPYKLLLQIIVERMCR